VIRTAPDGLRHRTSDKLIIEEAPGVYGNVPVESSDVVLDLGAHIGIAARLFLAKGARHVVAVEADPANIPLLRHNLAGARKQATIIPAAVGCYPGRMPFYTRPDRGYVGSILADPDRRKLTVPVVPFSGLLKTYRPTVLKCDIEFSEYELPELLFLPDHVRVIAMEVHIRFIGIFTGRKMDADELRERREAATDLIAAIEAQGFREHWRKDKQAKVGEPRAEDDGTGLGPMTKCVCVTWVR
jgi:FkbM family methyltransferase